MVHKEFYNYPGHIRLHLHLQQLRDQLPRTAGERWYISIITIVNYQHRASTECISTETVLLCFEKKCPFQNMNVMSCLCFNAVVL